MEDSLYIKNMVWRYSNWSTSWSIGSIIIVMFIYPFLTITSILIDQSLEFIFTISSIIMYSILLLLIYLLVILFIIYQLHSLLIIRKSAITSSFFIPIYEDLLLLLSCHFFRSQINLIEVLLGFNIQYSVFQVNFISIMNLISILLLFSLVVLI